MNAKILHNQLINNQIFATFNLQNRKLIQGKLSKIANLIVSFLSFFANINYLHIYAYNMRHLIKLLPTQMLCNALNAIYFGALKNWDFAYQLLWLYTMQNATDLPPPTELPLELSSKEIKIKKKRLAKARPKKVNKVTRV